MGYPQLIWDSSSEDSSGISHVHPIQFSEMQPAARKSCQDQPIECKSSFPIHADYQAQTYLFLSFPSRLSASLGKAGGGGSRFAAVAPPPASGEGGGPGGVGSRPSASPALGAVRVEAVSIFEFSSLCHSTRSLHAQHLLIVLRQQCQQVSVMIRMYGHVRCRISFDVELFKAV